MAVTLVAEDEGGGATEVTRAWRLDGDLGKAVSTGHARGGGEDESPGESLRARVVYVPAAHEPGSGGRDTVLQSLVDAMAGHRAAGGAGPPRGVAKAGLGRVEEEINKKLGARDGVGYAPNVGVRLGFADREAQTGLKMTITDRETGRDLDYAHVGHGARRALHMAALETNADILAGSAAGMATLYIIDEPELHQHPQRQDLVFDALRRLSEKPSSQVIYATHSPHFVSLGAQMGIYRVRRTGAGIGIRGTAGAAGMSVREGVARPIGEALFSNGAILVEGLHDEAIMRAVLRAAPHGGGTLMSALAGREIAIVNCHSKYNIEHYYRVLDDLGIACFVVWDGDMDKDEEPGIDQAKRSNSDLLKMVGADPKRSKEIEGAGGGDCVIGDSWACFGHNLPAYFSECFGRSPKDLVGRIKRGERIVDLLDKTRLFQSGFCRTALPALRRVLLG